MGYSFKHPSRPYGSIWSWTSKQDGSVCKLRLLRETKRRLVFEAVNGDFTLTCKEKDKALAAGTLTIDETT